MLVDHHAKRFVLPSRPPQTVSLPRSRAGYSAHALGVPYLPADAKGFYRPLGQAPTVAKSPTYGLPAQTCPQGSPTASLLLSHGERGTVLPPGKGVGGRQGVLMPLDAESIRIDGVTSGAYGRRQRTGARYGAVGLPDRVTDESGTVDTSASWEHEGSQRAPHRSQPGNG